MDKEEARFILRCFRPDGADAENPDFADALAWAAKDRELGEWLARERSRDADFACALNSVGIPPVLREEILVSLAMERGDAAIYPDSFDVSVIGAMAGIRPPIYLRGEILSAMERTAAEPKARRWWHYGLPAAAAAGIALAFLATRPGGSDGSDAKDIVGNPPVDETLRPENPDRSDGGLVPVVASLPISQVEEEFIKIFETPGYKLDLDNPDHHALFDHLKASKLPCPNRCLPEGLKKIPGLGCRELEIEGKKGALVCFKQENDEVHLMVFKRCDVKCKLPKAGQPAFGKHGKWSVARWSDEDWVFVLMGEKNAERKQNVDRKRLEDMF
ncbi:hypothetical protein OKA05_06825 [Luteolibacter arcticus]|uniref:Uncharacterized protein n=1 Tax=Luteolibacter arcticus TaxID=1581411 RepID=A0ABT3GF82_9BACT|nr:hypothetical protein [Luteolibacter arcticus]MCW1922260.1 hypothetical protein [Luteolibacter arcticus]